MRTVTNDIGTFQRNVIQGLWVERNVGRSAQPHSPVRHMLREAIRHERARVYGLGSNWPMHPSSRRSLRLTRTSS